jgi:two-component system, cell cycle sensor histidine kinase and response regulator CckA
MTGVELAKEIVALRPDMPVILCTGISRAASVESAKVSGIRGFLLKPLARRRSRGLSGRCSTSKSG